MIRYGGQGGGDGVADGFGAVFFGLVGRVPLIEAIAGDRAHHHGHDKHDEAVDFRCLIFCAHN